jgi:hypothetical protein
LRLSFVVDSYAKHPRRARGGLITATEPLSSWTARKHSNKLIDRASTIRKAADIADSEPRESWDQHGGDVETMARRLLVSVRALKIRLRRLHPEAAPD